MDFSITSYTLAPSLLTVGVTAAAVALTCVLAFLAVRRWFARAAQSSSPRAFRCTVLVVLALLLPLATRFFFFLIFLFIMPSASTVFVRPSLLALVVPLGVLACSAVWHISGRKLYRQLAVALPVLLLCAAAIQTAHTLEEWHREVPGHRRAP
jgi:CDP-diglyceride synthetase